MFALRLALIALRSLESHFLRSLLATLGVLIGVGSVVACMSILEGATNQIMSNFESLGSNLIFVQPSVARIQGRVVGRAQTLMPDDARVIQREMGDEVKAVAAQAAGTALVKYFQKSDTYSVVATSSEWFEMNDYRAAAGKVLDDSSSDDELSQVVCLGAEVAERLFGGMDPVGQTIKLRNAAYRVIGTMEERGNIGFLDADKTVYIPIRSGLKRFFNRPYLDLLTVQVSDEPGVDIDKVKKKLEQVMRAAHKIRPGQDDDFEVDTLDETIDTVSQATLIFKVVFYSIAGISLVVGGIGIMNIMLVSVTERTREIGVRMAVGARRGDILLQFLVEALIISLLGGGFGLLLGMMFSDLLDKVLQGMFTTEITPTVIITALLTTTVVGVFSGLYPAYKASRLDPVEALRYE
ncbi:MAG: FtsX-like permease family protein [Planctomycetota bacterium]|nr:MAG: FtsX-like permease family protein [Planctomycetota bacterium]